MSQVIDPFGALTEVDLSEGPTSFYSLKRLAEAGVADLDRLPYSIRISHIATAPGFRIATMYAEKFENSRD